MNQRVDDFIAREPDWQEWLEDRDPHCWNCDGKVVFEAYDSIRQEIKVRCVECGDDEWRSTEPDPDGGHDRED